MASAQVKSKQRVADHGEVFTSEREVNAMLDLVKQETERIESRFLEPACGNGNFLAEVLRRKLDIVRKRYSKSQLDYEKYSFLAVSSIYGVDILSDNAQECRERLIKVALDEYRKLFKKTSKEAYSMAIQYLLSRNIVCGDALNFKTDDGKPIVFSEWSFVMGSKVKRRDFIFDSLLNASDQQPSFDMSENLDVDKDAAGKAIPTPVKEYPLTSFLEVMNYE